MKLNFFLTIILVSSYLNYSVAQGKKDIKKNKMRTITEFVTVTENGNETSYKAYYVVYNKNAEIIEEIEYSSNGTIKKKETTKYDANGNKVEETCFQQKEKKNTKSNSEQIENVNIKTTYKYNVHNDKTEEDEIDLTSAKLIKKHIFSYNNNGEKNSDETFNSENKMIKKETFTYNNKGLKVEKKTFNENNELETTKKYVFEFY